MRLSNNLLRVHIAGFEKAIVALRAAPSQGRLYEEIAELFAQNANAAGDDALALVVLTAMQQIAASVPDLPAQQASKYQNWLLTRYRQNWAAQTEINPPQPLLLEDLSKYAEDLTLYHNTPNAIKKRAGINTDLFAINSPFELYQQLKALRGEVATEFKPLSPSQQAFIDSHQAIVIGQTAQWRLIMPLTIAASQEFGAGTRWCTAAQSNNQFTNYFPNNVLLYLEASGVGKTAFVMKEGETYSIFDSEDTLQTAAQQQALFNKLPTLAATLQNLEATVPLLHQAIDKADFATAFNLVVASRNLVPQAPIYEAMLVEKAKSANLVQQGKDHYFIEATKIGLLKTTEALLKLGADVHARNDDAFCKAAGRGYTDMVRLLLEHGANVNVDDEYALRLSAVNERTELVRLLLEYGADVHYNDDGALRQAASYGDTDLVKLLLEHGANVHAMNDQALRLAANHGHTDVVNILKAHIAKQAAQTSRPQKPQPNSPPTNTPRA